MPSTASFLSNVCSCNACACEREEEATASEPATESEGKATLSEEPLRQETIERLKRVFAEMDLDGNHGLTSDEAQALNLAFFVMLFDELPAGKQF